METQSNSVKIQMPEVWSFINPTEYLRQVYAFRKQRLATFSYGMWADELGLKSRSFLRLVLLEKRSLTVDLAVKIAENLKLKKQEAQFFLHLTGMHRAGELKTKEYHSREIARLRTKFQLRSNTFLEIDRKDVFNFLSDYRMPRLQCLLNEENLKRTPQTLADLLSLKVSEVKQMLENLNSLGLAKEQDRQWISLHSQIKTVDDLGNIALQSFHRKSLEEAAAAIELPKETRRFQSLVVNVSKEQMTSIHTEITSFFESLISKYSEGNLLDKKVYQLNINLIPVSRSIDQADLLETVEDRQKTKETI